MNRVIASCLVVVDLWEEYGVAGMKTGRDRHSYHWMRGEGEGEGDGEGRFGLVGFGLVWFVARLLLII